MRDLCSRFLEDYSKPKNSKSTVQSNKGYIGRYILPAFGSKKARDITRVDVADLITRMKRIPVQANRTLSCLRKMFNMAEVWGYREDGTNPCRHIPKYPENGKTRLITDGEMIRLFGYLDRADEEGLEHPFITLAIRLQFAFAARMSEIISLEWAWVDFARRRIVWPDSKTGEMSKPMSEESFCLLSNAPRLENRPYVIPSIFNPDQPMPPHTYAKGWGRILERAGVPHIGTHGIRHRATTEIANSGVPVKVGMALTAHKTVTMFMRYVHTEDAPIRAAAEAVAQRRLSLIGCSSAAPASVPVPKPVIAPPSSAPKPVEPPSMADRNLLGLEDGKYTSRTPLGNYRPLRHRENRAVPPGTKWAAKAQEATDAR